MCTYVRVCIFQMRWYMYNNFLVSCPVPFFFIIKKSRVLVRSIERQTHTQPYTHTRILLLMHAQNGK